MSDAILRLILEAQNKNPDEITALREELEGATNATREYTDADDELIQSLRHVGEEADKAGKTVVTVGDEGEKAGKKGKSAMDEWAKENRLKERFELLGKVIDGVGKAFDLAATEAEKLGRTDVSDNIAEMRAELGDFTDSLMQVSFSLADVWPPLNVTVKGLQALGVNTDAITKKRDFLQWMGDAAEGATNAMNVAQALTIAWEKQKGAITEEEAAQRAAALVAETLTEAQRAQIDALISAEAATEDAKDQYDALAVSQALAAKATEDARLAEEAANDVYAMAKQALEAANVPLFQKIDLQNQLAVAARLTTEKELEQQEAIGFLTKQLELGNISLDEYKQAVDDLATGTLSARDAIQQTSDAINNIPDRDVYLRYHYQTFGSEPGGDAPVIVPDDGDGGVYGGAQAEGGDYWVTRPTWFLAGEAGPEQATFTPASKARSDGAATVNISVDARGALDPRAVEAAGYRGARRALDEAGVKADIRRRIS